MKRVEGRSKFLDGQILQLIPVICTICEVTSHVSLITNLAEVIGISATLLTLLRGDRQGHDRLGNEH